MRTGLYCQIHTKMNWTQFFVNTKDLLIFNGKGGDDDFSKKNEIKNNQQNLNSLISFQLSRMIFFLGLVRGNCSQVTQVGLVPNLQPRVTIMYKSDVWYVSGPELSPPDPNSEHYQIVQTGLLRDLVPVWKLNTKLKNLCLVFFWFYWDT